jgi:hypothetical protein
VASISPGDRPGWLVDELSSTDLLDTVVGDLGLARGQWS